MCGKTPHGNHRSQALADEMADVWEPIMLRDFTDVDLTQAFLDRASPPVGIDDSEVMAVISIDDVCASLRGLNAIRRQDLMNQTTPSTETTLMHLRLFLRHCSPFGLNEAFFRFLLRKRTSNVQRKRRYQPDRWISVRLRS